MVYLYALASAVAAIVGNITSKYWADRGSWLWILVTAVAYAISTVAFIYALRAGGKFTVLTVLFYAFVPVITLGVGFLLFKEQLTTLQIVGLVLGMASIVLLAFEGAVPVNR